MYNYKSLLCTKYMLSWITSKIITHVQVCKHFIWITDYIVTRGSRTTVLTWATSITSTGNWALYHLQGLTFLKKNSCDIHVKWHILWFCKIYQKIIFTRLENFPKYFWKVKLSGRFPMKHMRTLSWCTIVHIYISNFTVAYVTVSIRNCFMNTKM